MADHRTDFGSATGSMADYYELLGVSRDAGADEIKKAYRRRARELHPDVNDAADAEEQFRNVTAAYEVLTDDERRAIYDQYGEEGLKQQQWEPQFANFGSLADILGAFFGDDVFGMGGMSGAGRADGARRGDDVAVSLSLTFAEAALGTTREIEYDAVGECSTCDGSGAATADGVANCETCNGAGRVRRVTRSILGQVIQETVCPTCSGRGRVVTDPCSACAGSGEEVKRHTLKVEVPAGVADGQRIRLSGRGGSGRMGGGRGNLYVNLHVDADDRFVREGDDLISVVDLTVTQAILGCEVDVDTVDGTSEKLTIEAGVQPGTFAVLRGKGMGRIRGGGRGDQRVVLNVQIPRNLDATQRSLVQRLQGSEDEQNYAPLREESILGKLRRMLRG